MEQSNRFVGAALLGAALGLTTLTTLATGTPALAQPTGPIAQPIARPAPANAAKARAVVDLASALAQTAAVVEGTVSELRAEYNDAEGPWTRVVLGDVKVHAGALANGKTVELWQFGGALPGGRVMVAAELPVFSKGKRYVVFLRNTEWNVSPVVGPWALRVEPIDTREALVTSDGQTVLGVGEGGLALGAARFEPAPLDGSAAKPLPAAATPAPTATPTPLDRGAFLAALKAAMAAQQLRASGAFLERPAGRFQWRGQAVTPHGHLNPNTAAGRDTSGGPR